MPTITRHAGLLVALTSVVLANRVAPAEDKSQRKAPPDEQVARLRSELRSDDPAVRRSAVRSLPHSPAATALTPELIAALKDTDGEVREWAATVLGPQGAAAVAAVPQLIVQLQTDPVNKARETAARALGRIGKAVPTERRALSALEKAATDDADSVTRVVALGALALMEPEAPARVAAVGAYLKHDDALTRMKAVHALGYLLDKAHAAGPDFAHALQQATDPYQRGYIARALGQIGAKEQLPILLAEYAKETDPRAQGEMRGAIKRLGGTVPAGGVGLGNRR